MTRIICHVSAATIPPSNPPDEVHVLLYSGTPARGGTTAIGGQLRDAFVRLGIPPTRLSVDFVTLALAVTAADTFVLRDDADNGWGRDLRVELPLGRPDVWEGVRADLERTLQFLSGDHWTFEFADGGLAPPTNFEVRNRQPWIDLTRIDCLSLFSGGLDSAIGALDLLSDGQRPLLVSHAYRGDADHQDRVAAFLSPGFQRFSVNAWPTGDDQTDVSMRTRSFNFIAFATLAAQARSDLKSGAVTKLLLPENGLIALNPPLTPRRLGSLSTRTTHPHYLSSLQAILDQVGFTVSLSNPYERQTKGEMTQAHQARPNIEQLAQATVSCGVWKRKNQQCGRCVPCLIRRSSLYAAGVDDKTSYESPDLHAVLDHEDARDDLIAMLSAAKRRGANNLERWVTQAGLLPVDSERRGALVDVCRRGLDEVASYLRDSGLSVD